LRPEPVYRHAAIRDLYTRWHVAQWRFAHDDAIDAALGKAAYIYDFFFGFWPLLIPALLWPYRLKTIEERAAAFILVVFLAVAILPLSGLEIHYAAPIAGLLYVRFLQTLSRLHGWRPAGKPLGAAVAVFFVTLLIFQFATNLALLFHGAMNPTAFAAARNSIAQELAHMPGRQLVLVRYAPGHNPLEEWVWNRADIDGSQTVWAREMGPSEDAPFLDYFHDRRVWLIEPDRTPPHLAPYAAQEPAPR